MQAGVYTSNVTQRQHRMLSRDGRYVWTDVLLMLPVKSESANSRQSFSCERLFHRPFDIKKPAMCMHTRKYGCVNAENKMHDFVLCSRQWRNCCLIRDKWIFHIPWFSRNVYACRKTTEFVLLMIPRSGYCLAWWYEFLPRGRAEKLLTEARFMLPGNLSLLCYACKTARQEK